MCGGSVGIPKVMAGKVFGRLAKRATAYILFYYTETASPPAIREQALSVAFLVCCMTYCSKGILVMPREETKRILATYLTTRQEESLLIQHKENSMSDFSFR